MRLPKKWRSSARRRQSRIAVKASCRQPSARLCERREVAVWPSMHPLAQERLGSAYFEQVYGRGGCGVQYAMA